VFFVTDVSLLFVLLKNLCCRGALKTKKVQFWWISESWKQDVRRKCTIIYSFTYLLLLSTETQTLQWTHYPLRRSQALISKYWNNWMFIHQCSTETLHICICNDVPYHQCDTDSTSGFIRRFNGHNPFRVVKHIVFQYSRKKNRFNMQNKIYKLTFQSIWQYPGLMLNLSRVTKECFRLLLLLFITYLFLFSFLYIQFLR